MNRQERHAAGKGQSKQRLVASGITVFFDNGTKANLKLDKIQIVDRETMRPIFEEALQVEPQKLETPRQEFADEPDKQSYTVEFDTPEGMMIFVKEGDWSGVRPA